jgi:hypothetical protein
VATSAPTVAQLKADVAACAASLQQVGSLSREGGKEGAWGVVMLDRPPQHLCPIPPRPCPELQANKLVAELDKLPNPVEGDGFSAALMPFIDTQAFTIRDLGTQADELAASYVALLA